MKRVTQIENVRALIEQNSNYINSTFNRTDLDAKTYLFESGCRFLELIYGYGSAPYIKHSRSPKFWSWFRLQWHGVEEGYLQLHRKQSNHIPQGIIIRQYQKYMSFFCGTSERMEKAFMNYLKQAR